MKLQPDVSATLKFSHAAMGTYFEVYFPHSQATSTAAEREHLAAVADLLWQELDRLEQLLSRFSPSSETVRINRQAIGRPLRTQPELIELLAKCQKYAFETDGYFWPLHPVAVDETVGKGSDSIAEHKAWPAFKEIVTLDPHASTVQLASDEFQLDFGAIGKGYALDCLVEILRSFQIENALLHGGTSSIYALGRLADLTSQAAEQVTSGWPVAFAVAAGMMQTPETSPPPLLYLTNTALSSSATLAHFRAKKEPSVVAANLQASDILNPKTRQRLTQPDACTVLAANATEAEVWSTAFLAMGKPTAEQKLCTLSAAKTQGLATATPDVQMYWHSGPNLS